MSFNARSHLDDNDDHKEERYDAYDDDDDANFDSPPDSIHLLSNPPNLLLASLPPSRQESTSGQEHREWRAVVTPPCFASLLADLPFEIKLHILRFVAKNAMNSYRATYRLVRVQNRRPRHSRSDESGGAEMSYQAPIYSFHRKCNSCDILHSQLSSLRLNAYSRQIFTIEETYEDRVAQITAAANEHEEGGETQKSSCLRGAAAYLLAQQQQQQQRRRDDESIAIPIRLCDPPSKEFPHLCKMPARDTHTLKNTLQVSKEVRKKVLSEALHTVFLESEVAFMSFVKLLNRGGVGDGNMSEGWLSEKLRGDVKRLWVNGILLHDHDLASQLYYTILPRLPKLEALSICNARLTIQIIPAAHLSSRPVGNSSDIIESMLRIRLSAWRIMEVPKDGLFLQGVGIWEGKEVTTTTPTEEDESVFEREQHLNIEREFPISFGTHLRTLTLMNMMLPDLSESFERPNGERFNPFLNLEHLRIVLPFVPYVGVPGFSWWLHWTTLSHIVPRAKKREASNSSEAVEEEEGGKLKVVEFVEPWPTSLGANSNDLNLESIVSLFDALVIPLQTSFRPHSQQAETAGIDPVQVVITSVNPFAFRDFFYTWQVLRAHHPDLPPGLARAGETVRFARPANVGIAPLLEIRRFKHMMSCAPNDLWSIAHQDVLRRWNMEAWLDDDLSIGPSERVYSDDFLP